MISQEEILKQAQSLVANIDKAISVAFIKGTGNNRVKSVADDVAKALDQLKTQLGNGNKNTK